MSEHQKSEPEEICGTCYYFRPDTCRINPPIHEWFKPANSSWASPFPKWDSPFPQTQFTSWCGQYEPKE